MKNTVVIDFTEVRNAQDYNDAIESAKDLVNIFGGTKSQWENFAKELCDIFVPKDGILPDDGRMIIVNAYMSHIPTPDDTTPVQDKHDEIEKIVAFGEIMRKAIDDDMIQDMQEWWLDIAQKIINDFKGSPDLFPFNPYEWNRIWTMLTMIVVLSGEDWILTEADRKLLVGAGPMILWAWWRQATDTPNDTEHYNNWVENVLPTLIQT
jgi:hypothetical protein